MEPEQHLNIPTSSSSAALAQSFSKEEERTMKRMMEEFCSWENVVEDIEPEEVETAAKEAESGTEESEQEDEENEPAALPPHLLEPNSRRESGEENLTHNHPPPLPPPPPPPPQDETEEQQQHQDRANAATFFSEGICCRGDKFDGVAVETHENQREEREDGGAQRKAAEEGHGVGGRLALCHKEKRGGGGGGKEGKDGAKRDGRATEVSERFLLFQMEEGEAAYNKGETASAVTKEAEDGVTASASSSFPLLPPSLRATVQETTTAAQQNVSALEAMMVQQQPTTTATHPEEGDADKQNEVNDDPNVEEEKEKEKEEQEKDDVSEDVTSGASPPSTSGWLPAFVMQLSGWLVSAASSTIYSSSPSSTAFTTETNSEDEDVIEEDSMLWQDWEWILTEAEKFVIQRSKEEASTIQKELMKLRKGANLLKTKPLFHGYARLVFEELTLSEENKEKLRTTVLDSSKRSKIVTDVVNAFEEEWLQFCALHFFEQLGPSQLTKKGTTTPKQRAEREDEPEVETKETNCTEVSEEQLTEKKEELTDSEQAKDNQVETRNSNCIGTEEREGMHKPEEIPTEEEQEEIPAKGTKEQWATFKEAWGESAYKKGVIGGMKEVGWQASHGPGGIGLNRHVLADIGWSFWKSIVSSLRWVLDRELRCAEQDLLAEKISYCMRPLAYLWWETIQNSEIGSSNAGILPAKWKKEQEKEEHRIRLLKKLNRHARYEGPTPPKVKSITRKQLTQLKSMLEQKLTFRIRENTNSF